jgi:hypothetical protein
MFSLRPKKGTAMRGECPRKKRRESEGAERERERERDLVPLPSSSGFSHWSREDFLKDLQN